MPKNGRKPAQFPVRKFFGQLPPNNCFPCNNSYLCVIIYQTLAAVMVPNGFTHILTRTVDELSDSQSFKELFHQQREGERLPSLQVLNEIIDLIRSILFPGYYGNSSINRQTIKYHIGVDMEKLFHLLAKQIYAGLCFSHEEACEEEEKSRCVQAEKMAARFIERLPLLRKTLATDVEAMYNGDPAAESFGEVIFCYPAIKAITNYRIAHELLGLGAQLIPRIITEMAHSETGIDINPGARIGTHFAIDHGTGVVIGATTVIGNNVKIYQGVTLGAKSFPIDEQGNIMRGIPRHPIIEDDVIIYSNASILGRITIGKGAVIGGNIWITEDVPPGGRILQKK